ncbi:MAG: hypothetical protein H0U66_07450 [Gemmatimonadaceae bacterium]|nr:hypothetical protein [Gemmatimonadaceae bacterium]
MSDSSLPSATAPYATNFSGAGSFERFMEHLPAAFALTSGSEHVLAYANEAFRKLVTLDGQLAIGSPIGSLFGPRDRVELTALLDRAFRSRVVSRNRAIAPELRDTDLLMRCTVWPDVGVNGETNHLLIELRAATQDELKVGLQRRVAERLMLSALREQDAAAIEAASRRSAEFLEAEGRRLAESLDEARTLDAISRLSLPRFSKWCFVDLANGDGTMRRLPIVHPDPVKQAVLSSLGEQWIPESSDEFGLPALSGADPAATYVEDAVTAAASGSLGVEIADALRSVGAGAMLTVPLFSQRRLAGAVTFVGNYHGAPITPADIALAGELASRSAMALDRARLHGDAIACQRRAESANAAKGAFLGMMSHELRTPLNAIAGYVDLIDMELRGPVTAAQHGDLARIRANQKYLNNLINELLNLTKIAGGGVAYDTSDLDTCDVLTTSVAMLEPLLAQHQLTFDGVFCDASLVARGDREKVIQILINLLSNSIKFTRAGGHLRIDASETADKVAIRVSDTGIGMNVESLTDIFEPFVQLGDRLTGSEGGIGLGLAISRDLARAMGGDLTAESIVGEGSSFNLTLPRAL